MNNDDEKTLLKIATAAVGAVALFGILKQFSNWEESERKAEPMKPNAPKEKAAKPLRSGRQQISTSDGSSGDAWMDEVVAVRIVYDTAQCSACFRVRNMSSIDLISNFCHVGKSSLRWIDEASYGMCSHHCTKSELIDLYEILKAADISNWKDFNGNDINFKPEYKEIALKNLREYIEVWLTIG